MDSACINCHSTAKTNPQGFDPAVYGGHRKQGYTCTECHIEHVGKDSSAGLVNYSICFNCHNGQFKVKKDGINLRAGDALPIPHGGTVNYPVNDDGSWKLLTAQQITRHSDKPGFTTAKPEDKFHIIHFKFGDNQGGNFKISNDRCFLCHVQDPLKKVNGNKEVVKQMLVKCGDCHGVSGATDAMPSKQSNCISCHQQHTRSKYLDDYYKRQRDAIVASQGNHPDQKTQLIAKIDKDQNAARENTKNGLSVITVDGGPQPPVITGSLSSFRQNRELITGGMIGGIPWYGWLGLLGLLPLTGIGFVAVRSSQRRGRLIAETRQARKVDKDAAGLKAGGLTTPELVKYNAERIWSRLPDGVELDDLISADHLDAIVAPTNGPAWVTNYATGDAFTLGSSGPAAVAGYPDISVPAGFAGPLPLGVSFMAGKFSDAHLLAIASAFEQVTHARRAPTFLPTSATP